MSVDTGWALPAADEPSSLRARHDDHGSPKSSSRESVHSSRSRHSSSKHSHKSSRHSSSTHRRHKHKRKDRGKHENSFDKHGIEIPIDVDQGFALPAVDQCFALPAVDQGFALPAVDESSTSKLLVSDNHSRRSKSHDSNRSFHKRSSNRDSGHKSTSKKKAKDRSDERHDHVKKHKSSCRKKSKSHRSEKDSKSSKLKETNAATKSDDKKSKHEKHTERSAETASLAIGSVDHGLEERLRLKALAAAQKLTNETTSNYVPKDTKSNCTENGCVERSLPLDPIVKPSVVLKAELESDSGHNSTDISSSPQAESAKTLNDDISKPTKKRETDPISSLLRSSIVKIDTSSKILDAESGSPSGSRGGVKSQIQIVLHQSKNKDLEDGEIGDDVPNIPLPPATASHTDDAECTDCAECTCCAEGDCDGMNDSDIDSTFSIDQDLCYGSYFEFSNKDKERERRKRAHRSRRSRSPTDKKSTRSRSPSHRHRHKSRRKSSDEIERERLFRVAKANLSKMLDKGSLPKGFEKVPPSLIRELSSLKSIKTFTKACRRIQLGKDADSDSDDDRRSVTSTGRAFKKIRHPFNLDEKRNIEFRVRDFVQMAARSAAEIQSEMLESFPVSSGLRHRKRELEWKETDKLAIEAPPIMPPSFEKEKKMKEAIQMETIALAYKAKEEEDKIKMSHFDPVDIQQERSVVLQEILAPKTSSVILDFLTSAKTASSADSDPNNVPASSSLPSTQETSSSVPQHEVGSVMAQRLTALRVLKDDPYNLVALKQLRTCDEKIKEWAQEQRQSSSSSGETLIGPVRNFETNRPAPTAWASADTLKRAAPIIDSNVGMYLLVKMGWKPGEGLGMYKQGQVEPIAPTIKLDTKGLRCGDELARNLSAQVISAPHSTPSGAPFNPIARLHQLSTHRRWFPPEYHLVQDEGPPHRKSFTFQVVINGVTYQPSVACPNKKQARALAASVALQSFGLLPKD